MLVDDVKLIVWENSITEKEANVKTGENVNQIYLFSITPKNLYVSDDVYRVITKSFPDTKRMVFVNTETLEVVALNNNELLKSSELQTLEISGFDLDGVWNSFLAQIVFNDTDGTNIEARIINKKKIDVLEKEIKKLDKQSRKSKHFSIKNELFKQAGAKRRELKMLKEDM